MSRSTRKPTSLHIVAVCFYLQPAELVAKLRTLASRCGTQLHGVVVTNNAAHLLTSPCSDVEVIRGSNMHLDFSGYFEGLEWLTAINPDVALGNVLFVNDSLITKHAAACILRQVVKLHGIIAQLSVPAIGGKMDAYRSICLRNPWSGHAGYVSSYCFLLNALAQPAMRALLDNAAADGVLSTSPLSDPAWGAELMPALRESIRSHLVYESSPYLWKSGGSDNIELIRKKARCVYFESRLSGAIGSNGAVLPINSGPRSNLQLVLAETLARVARPLRGSRQ